MPRDLDGNWTPPEWLDALMGVFGVFSMLGLMFCFVTGVGLLQQARVEQVKEKWAGQMEVRNSIYGKVARVATGREVDDPSDPFQLGAPKTSYNFTDVFFQDGRKKRFIGEYNKPFPIGEDVELVYTDLRVIVEIKPWDPKAEAKAAEFVGPPKP